MTAIFEHYLRSQANFSEEDLARIISSAQQKLLARNESVLVQGEICKHKIFVCEGLLRNYAVTPQGTEHILHFVPENSWTLDAESYDRQVPSRFAISAVEKSKVMLWKKEDFNSLLEEIPLLKTLSEQIISRNIYQSRQRIISAISASPGEKYEEFVLANPKLLSRLPLHMIASYLGISLKTLTRIRHAQLKR